MVLKPCFTFTLRAKAFVKGYLDIKADTIEEAQAQVPDRLGDVPWGYDGLDDDASITGDIGGPALYGKDSVLGVTIVEESPRCVRHAASTHVTTIMVGDEEVEIRRLASGALVGIDASYLAQMGDEDELFSPYDADTVVDVPDNEA